MSSPLAVRWRPVPGARRPAVPDPRPASGARPTGRGRGRGGRDATRRSGRIPRPPTGRCGGPSAPRPTRSGWPRSRRRSGPPTAGGTGDVRDVGVQSPADLVGRGRARRWRRTAGVRPTSMVTKSSRPARRLGDDIRPGRGQGGGQLRGACPGLAPRGGMPSSAVERDRKMHMAGRGAGHGTPPSGLAAAPTRSTAGAQNYVYLADHSRLSACTALGRAARGCVLPRAAGRGQRSPGRDRVRERAGRRAGGERGSSTPREGDRGLTATCWKRPLGQFGRPGRRWRRAAVAPGGGLGPAAAVRHGTPSRARGFSLCGGACGVAAIAQVVR